jgi:hypothetical protein
MILSDLSIRRPVFASMVSVAIVLFGVIGYRELAVREYPDVDPPLISVFTALPGANPQVVESAVTDVLEEELSTVPGIRTLTSSSAEQSSNISIEFQLDRDVEAAAQDVRDKVARVRNRLPQDVLEPVIAKQEADARPFLWLALSGDNVDLLRLSGCRRSHGEGAAADHLGRRQRHHRRRAALRDARVALDGGARGPAAHGAGRRGRDPLAQRRDPGGPHRVVAPRVQRALAG